MKHLTSLTAFLILLAFNASAQRTWKNFNASNSGLLTNQISSITFDPDSNLWVAYADAGGEGPGMSKFDGKNWTSYTTKNSGLLNNGVRVMTADREGNMWFACYNAGIVKFDGNAWIPYTTENSGIVNNNVTTIKFDKHGNLWVGAYGYGISRFDGSTWTTYNYQNSPFPEWFCVNDVLIDTHDNLWVALDCGGGLAKRDVAGTWTHYTRENSDIPYHTSTALIADTAQNIWVGLLGGKAMWRYDGTDWHTLSFAGNSVSYNSFALDSSGAVWASGDDGLYQFDGTTWNRENIADAKKTFGLSNQSIAVDPAGNIWWGQYFEGIWKGTTVTVTGIAPASEIPVTASPNPFSHHAILSFPNPKNEPHTLTLRNSTGGVVWTNTGIRSEEATIDGTNLSDGLYFYSLENGRAKKSSGRLVVKK